MLSCIRPFGRSGVGVELERLALKRTCAAFLVANEGKERLDEDTEDVWNEDE